MLIRISALAGAGAVLYTINGYQHAFAIEDISISYPLRPDTVSITVVGVIALLVPAIVIALITLFLIPGTSVSKGTPRSDVWRRKLWEWNTGWLGLGLSLAGAFFVTSALKDLAGKPRPNLLARCDPDLSNLAGHSVGGLGLVIDEALVMVDLGICKNPDQNDLQNGFESFPSGHSSFSWAGLLYLTLWVCAKFAITIPFLTPHHNSPEPNSPEGAFRPVPYTRNQNTIAPRDRAAAPPLYLLVIALTPIAAATYVSVSRWTDYQHHGFDIIVGSLTGAGFAWLGFRWYHLPVRRGAGWSWGPRSRDRAFYISPGRRGFAGSEGWESESSRRNPYMDIELGPVQAGGSGITRPGE